MIPKASVCGCMLSQLNVHPVQWLHRNSQVFTLDSFQDGPKLCSFFVMINIIGKFLNYINGCYSKAISYAAGYLI